MLVRFQQQACHATRLRTALDVIAASYRVMLLPVALAAVTSLAPVYVKALRKM